MTISLSQFSTGLPGLDRILEGLLPGDNVVWQVDSPDDYRPFVAPYCRWALAKAAPLVYFRFARHEPLVTPGDGVQVRGVRPEAGFEPLINEVRATIKTVGRGACYVFDCLSDLAADWYSDQMLGNFFMLTCPHLFDMETVAYFAVLRGNHSTHATVPIAETTQLLLDVYRHAGRLYVHPVKVQRRHSPTMHMLHCREGDDFIPVTRSAEIAQVMQGASGLLPGPTGLRSGAWDRTVLQAAETIASAEQGQCDIQRARDLTRRLLRMAVTREPRMLALAERYLSPRDVLGVCERMIGTGLIGGKAVGMLLARAILLRADPRWKHLLEPHDSFYIGSDVYYTYLVRNGIWWVREKQRDPRTFLDDAGVARQHILTGTFPDYIERQLESLLDYFGQSPFIVRSSSLLEDNFGNAFAGKYDSVFCVNQGPRHQRLDDLLQAVRHIYAGAMSEKALRYRAQRNLLDRDEQMALLVQRVSGVVHGDLFLPHVAGVALSFNPYVWGPYIDPRAGVVRLVFGLGTRAVDRADDDYTRLVALNAPDRRPEADADDRLRYAQHRVDALDLAANRLASLGLAEVIQRAPDVPLELVASRIGDADRRAAAWSLTFDALLQDTPFAADMRDMLRTLEHAYDYPVEVEFTANMTDDGAYRVNVVQCRPLQVKGDDAAPEPPPQPPAERLLLAGRGPVIGRSTALGLDRIIFVVPEAYGQLPVNRRHEVARLLGRLTHATGADYAPVTMLLGPGRWGTSTPSLGVPVSFADIDTVSVLGEIVAMREDLVPDCSLGTHFLNELVELDMLYLALFLGQEGNTLNQQLLQSLPNRLPDLAPDAADWAHVVRVVQASDLPHGMSLRLHADSMTQRVTCYLAPLDD